MSVSSVRAHARSIIILSGIGALALLLAGLLAFDAYLFSLVSRTPQDLPAPAQKKTLRSRDIDDAIRFLDQRAATFQQIATSTAP